MKEQLTHNRLRGDTYKDMGKKRQKSSEKPKKAGKTKVLHIRCLESEWMAFNDTAIEAQRTLSDWARRSLLMLVKI